MDGYKRGVVGKGFRQSGDGMEWMEQPSGCGLSLGVCVEAVSWIELLVCEMEKPREVGEVRISCQGCVRLFVCECVCGWIDVHLRDLPYGLVDSPLARQLFLSTFSSRRSADAVVYADM